jgi:hypothetical protein
MSLLVAGGCAADEERPAPPPVAGYFANDGQQAQQRVRYEALMEACLTERGFEYVSDAQIVVSTYRFEEPLDFVFAPPVARVASVGYGFTEKQVVARVNGAATSRRIAEQYPDTTARLGYLDAVQGGRDGGDEGCAASAQAEVIREFGSSVLAEESNLAVEALFEQFFDALGRVPSYTSAVDGWASCMQIAGVASPGAPHLFRLQVADAVAQRAETALASLSSSDDPIEDPIAMADLLREVQDDEIEQATIDSRCQSSTMEPIRAEVRAVQDEVFGVLDIGQ